MEASYKQCPKCRIPGAPGTECFPWVWKQATANGVVEHSMSTPLCGACRAELANRRAPAYGGVSGGGGFSKYEFHSNERAPKYVPLPMGTLERSRMEFLERTNAECHS